MPDVIRKNTLSKTKKKYDKTQDAKRACDMCQKRKTKCIYSGGVCHMCVVKDTHCAFTTPVLKRGPKGGKRTGVTKVKKEKKGSKLAPIKTNGTLANIQPRLSGQTSPVTPLSANSQFYQTSMQQELWANQPNSAPFVPHLSFLNHADTYIPSNVEPGYMSNYHYMESNTNNYSPTSLQHYYIDNATNLVTPSHVHLPHSVTPSTYYNSASIEVQNHVHLSHQVTPSVYYSNVSNEEPNNIHLSHGATQPSYYAKIPIETQTNVNIMNSGSQNQINVNIMDSIKQNKPNVNIMSSPELNNAILNVKNSPPLGQKMIEDFEKRLIEYSERTQLITNIQIRYLINFLKEVFPTMIERQNLALEITDLLWNFSSDEMDQKILYLVTSVSSAYCYHVGLQQLRNIPQTSIHLREAAKHAFINSHLFLEANSYYFKAFEMANSTNSQGAIGATAFAALEYSLILSTELCK